MTKTNGDNEQQTLKIGQGAMFLSKLMGESHTCELCGKEGVTECEACGSVLCSTCSDQDAYEDVDVCKDKVACAGRTQEETTR